MMKFPKTRAKLPEIKSDDISFIGLIKVFKSEQQEVFTEMKKGNKFVENYFSKVQNSR